MAIGIHVATLGMVKVNDLGAPLPDGPSIAEVMASSSEIRVLYDATIPNTSGNPTIQAYLEAEAADDYVVRVLNQSFIVTYDAGDMNSAT